MRFAVILRSILGYLFLNFTLTIEQLRAVIQIDSAPENDSFVKKQTG